MSPWFSRGWTALELASSQKVFVLFKGEDGPLAVSLDQLLDSPRTEGHRLAADIIKRLRVKRIQDINHLLQALGPRHTSWSKDRMTIAGLLVGIGQESARIQEEDAQADNLPQQELTAQILAKIRYVSRGHLFHGLPTVACNSSWYPAQLLSLPLDDSGEVLDVDDQGAVIGDWRVLPVDELSVEQYRWDLIHPMIALRLRQTFQFVESHRCLLEMKEKVDRALIVRLDASGAFLLSCWVVGSLQFKQERGISGISFTEKWVKIMNVREDPSLTSSATHKAREEEKDARQIIPTLRDTKQGRGPHVFCQKPARRKLRAPQTFPHDWETDLIDFALPKSAGLLPLDIDTTEVHRMVNCFGYGLPATATARLGRTFSAESCRGFDITHCMTDTQSDVFVRDQAGRSSLSRAAGRGHIHEVQALLDRWTDWMACEMLRPGGSLQFRVDLFYNSMDNGGRTPLSWAAGEGHVEVVALLLRCPAVDLEVPSVCGWTPLWYAVDNGQIDAARLLLLAGAAIGGSLCAVWQPHVLGTASPQVPHTMCDMSLAFAVQLSADLAMIDMLLDCGAQLDDFAWRMLDAVIRDDKMDVQFLCDAGMRPNGISYSSLQELGDALRKGHRVPGILDHGDARSVQSLHDLAKRPRGHRDDRFSLTPMRVALVMGRAEIFAIMLEAGATLIDDGSENLHDLLRHAVEYHQLPSGTPNHQLAMIKMILQTLNCGVNRVDPLEGPLEWNVHIAAGRGDIDVVNLLLADPNVDVNVHRLLGRCETPLHDAILLGHANVVKALLQAPGIAWMESVPVRQPPEEIARERRQEYLEIEQTLRDFAKRHDRGEAGSSGGNRRATSRQFFFDSSLESFFDSVLAGKRAHEISTSDQGELLT